MTPERFEELSILIVRRGLLVPEVAELMNALLEARPELSANSDGDEA